MITRRGLITGATAILAAPAIVRAESIMPVRSLPTWTLVGPNITASDIEFRWSEPWAYADSRTDMGEYVSRHMTNLVLRMDTPPGFKPMRQSDTHK